MISSTQLTLGFCVRESGPWTRHSPGVPSTVVWPLASGMAIDMFYDRSTDPKVGLYPEWRAAEPSQWSFL